MVLRMRKGILLGALTGLLISLQSLAVIAADIYKSVDEQGRVIYTDKPSGDQPAQKVDLPPVNTLPPEPRTHQPAPTINRAARQQLYEVKIVSPKNNATLTAEQRDLGIAVTLDRPLEPNHWLLFFMNGELLEETQSNSVFIEEITRGSHTITVEVIDNKGASLGTSEQIVVNVIRPRVKRGK